MMGKSSIGPQIFAAMSASLILLCCGFHIGLMSLLVGEINDNYPSVSMIQLSWMLHTLTIGNIFGALLGPILVDICGRKNTLLLMTVPFVISCVLIVVANSFWWFYPARFLAGISIGVAFMVTPMYVGEIAESKIRGSLCVLMPVMIQIGQFVPQLIGPWLASAALGIVGAVIPIVFATSLIWVPESPYYYSMKRNATETRKSLAWLRGTPEVAHEVEEVDNSIALNRRIGINFINLFTMLSNRKALLVVIGLLSAQQLFDPLMTLSYFEMLSSGFGLELSYVTGLLMIIASVRLLVTIGIIFLVDKVGRRPLLLTSALICLVFLMVKALHSQLMMSYPGNDVSDTPWLSLVAIIGYSIGNAIGLGTVPMVMAGELFPCEVKAFALGLSMVFYFAAGFGASALCSLALNNISYNICYYALTACHFVLAIFIYFIVPETAGRSLNEIQVILRRPFKTQS